jgi:hypothetical protein
MILLDAFESAAEFHTTYSCSLISFPGREEKNLHFFEN